MKRGTSNFEHREISTKTIFPTLVHVEESFLKAQKCSELAASAQDKEDVNDAELKALILNLGLNALAAEFVDIQKYDAIELSEMWFNVLNPGDHHWDHTHANHVLSGVIYLTDRCFTIFGDPRPAAAVLSLNYNNAPAGHTRAYVHCGAKQSAILFPSWLPHRVATTNIVRKTISFNLMLRGPYGGSHSREQIIL